ncbi:MAG: gliding motility-associated C-terminal domain-containing protein [Bacteroidota bacterium]
MKKLLLVILIFQALLGAAQHERDNWFMGTYLGMKFNGTGMQVIPVNTSPSYAPYASATYSDPITGQLLFYTNGSYVYNRLHQQMPDGFYINGETFGIHSVIVPHPGNKFLYYIISSASTETKLYYATVDMRLQGGLGDLVYKNQVLDGTSDLPFCVVKQYYDEGYWVITHTAASNEFKSFRIGKNGLQPAPVLSYAGKPSPAGARYTYGKMVSNSSGDRFVFTHGRTNVTALAEEFSFDKACGIVTFRQSFFAQPIQAEEYIAYSAYSSDDSKLYISWIYRSGQTFLIQYNLKDASPNSTYVKLSQGNIYNGDLQLAPDGKIYVASAENAAVTAKVSVIESPNSLGVACNYRDKQVVLAANSNLYFTEHFPEFMMDVSPQPSGHEKPVLVFQNTCEGQPVNITLKAPLQADSVLLDLGDGTVLRKTEVVHQYSSIGNYAITLKWWTCGNEFSIVDTLKLRNTPKVQLGIDTTVCFGNNLILSGPPGAEEYRWNTGDSLAGLTVVKPGSYLLKVRDGNCWAEDEITVSYYDRLWTALGDEYFICKDDQELVKLDAGERFVQYKWTPTGDTTQWIIVGDVGDYFVVVKDYRGCNGNDGTQVKRRCPVSVFFPNVFSPNNDGLNDGYAPMGKDLVSFNMKIYNRWGQLIFQTNDLNKTWNGMLKGEAATADVYIYTAIYSGYINKRLREFTSKGSFTLLR